MRTLGLIRNLPLNMVLGCKGGVTGAFSGQDTHRTDQPTTACGLGSSTAYTPCVLGDCDSFG